MLTNTQSVQLAQWCPETLRVGQQLALDMEKAGIHLGEPQRNRMQVRKRGGSFSSSRAPVFRRAFSVGEKVWCVGSVCVNGGHPGF